jgi:stage III sporulation protein AH
MRRETLFRLAVLIVVVALLCTYIYIKWPLFNNVLGGKQGSGLTGGTQQTLAPDVLSTGGNSDFFVDYRLERERTRGQQIELLRELINNPQADEASRRSAGDRWLAIVNAMGVETELENLIRAKGFADAVVFIQEKTTVVVVKAAELSQPEAARIMDLAVRATGMKLDAVTLVVKPK